MTGVTSGREGEAGCSFQSSTCGDVALERRKHTSRTLRFGFWWSARLVKGAARAWVCMRLGAALSDSARLCPA